MRDPTEVPIVGKKHATLGNCDRGDQRVNGADGNPLRTTLIGQPSPSDVMFSGGQKNWEGVELVTESGELLFLAHSGQKFLKDDSGNRYRNIVAKQLFQSLCKRVPSARWTSAAEGTGKDGRIKDDHRRRAVL